MRLKNIRAFLFAYHRRSITRAADEMHLTQPAISKIIRMLEEDLGVDLFERSARGIEPSAAGHAFLPYAERILTDLEAARRELSALAGGRSGNVRVGADSYVLSEILPNAITHLLGRLPNLRVEIMTGVSDNLLASAANGEIDLCITSVSRRSNLAGLTVTNLLQEEYVVVARRGHPLERQAEVSLADIVAYPWVHVGGDFEHASNLVPLLEKNAVPLPKRIIEADSLVYVMAHLRQSDSLSYQPRGLLNAPDIATIDIADVPVVPHFRIVAGHKERQPLSPGARELLAEAHGLALKAGQQGLPH